MILRERLSWGRQESCQPTYQEFWERLGSFLLICFESLSLYFFMRNVNHFMKIKWINQAIALKTRLPRFLGLARCLGSLGNNCVIFLRKQEFLTDRCMHHSHHPATVVSCWANLMIQYRESVTYRFSSTAGTVNLKLNRTTVPAPLYIFISTVDTFPISAY